jgi:hypothetical protein
MPAASSHSQSHKVRARFKACLFRLSKKDGVMGDFTQALGQRWHQIRSYNKWDQCYKRICEQQMQQVRIWKLLWSKS